MAEELAPPTEGDESLSPAPAPEAQPAPAAPAADWRQSFDWSIDHNGQKVSPDSAEKARTWLSLGHNYSQRAAELNKREQAWQQQQRELQQKYQGYDRYSEIDQYARQNPDWWKHVESAYQQRATHGISPELQPVLQPILQDLQHTKSFIAELQEQRALEAKTKEDQALDAEIGEIRKQYPNIDLNAPDETGRSLEWRILNHANETGIRSFRAAFRDYLHDRLVSEAQANGRSAIAKDTQAKAKAGVLGVTPAPTKQLAPAQNVRGKSYAQLAQEAMAELGLTS